MQILIGFYTNIINICIGLSVGLSLSVRQCESNIAHFTLPETDSGMDRNRE